MDSLVNRWKSTVEAQMERQIKRSKSKNHTLSPSRKSLTNLETSQTDSFTESKPAPQNYVKSKAQKIIDILSVKGQDPPSISKFNKVCSAIEEIIKNEELKISEENNSEATKFREMRESTRIQSESINKTVSDLEARLFESEREKILLRKEKEELKSKIEGLNKQLASSSVTQEMIGVLKESFKALENSNKTLISNIETIKNNQREKERAWELEIEQLHEIIENIQKEE
ncbi:unnamed protein product [Blepharisma stoltei]|uniref:Uncharacterized protein n=1 Tax=Blepharisma stoltei TaxID=1481888 RepID=A0AAU9JMF8_9CILI|nr:unnamed protein product [Blepharisma stoltei]